MYTFVFIDKYHCNNIKEAIMQTLRQFLTEKTFNLSYEVNYLYKALGFEDYVKKIKEGKYNTPTPKKRISADEFMKIVKSKDIKEADYFIPLYEIRTDSNAGATYNPMNSIGAIITVSVSKNASEMYRDHKGDFSAFGKKDQNYLKYEISEDRIKGTIRHELSHWCSDATNGRYLSKRLNKMNNDPTRAYEILNKGGKQQHQFMTDYEIDAQIHAMQQHRISNRSKWRRYKSYKDALRDQPWHNPLEQTLSKSEYELWYKKFRKRAAREGIVGWKMRS